MVEQAVGQGGELTRDLGHLELPGNVAEAHPQHLLVLEAAQRPEQLLRILGGACRPPVQLGADPLRRLVQRLRVPGHELVQELRGPCQLGAEVRALSEEVEQPPRNRRPLMEEAEVPRGNREGRRELGEVEQRLVRVRAPRCALQQLERDPRGPRAFLEPRRPQHPPEPLHRRQRRGRIVEPAAGERRCARGVLHVVVEGDYRDLARAAAPPGPPGRAGRGRPPRRSSDADAARPRTRPSPEIRASAPAAPAPARGEAPPGSAARRPSGAGSPPAGGRRTPRAAGRRRPGRGAPPPPGAAARAGWSGPGAPDSVRRGAAAARRRRTPPRGCRPARASRRSRGRCSGGRSAS